MGGERLKTVEFEDDGVTRAEMECKDTFEDRVIFRSYLDGEFGCEMPDDKTASGWIIPLADAKQLRNFLTNHIRAQELKK